MTSGFHADVRMTSSQQSWVYQGLVNELLISVCILAAEMEHGHFSYPSYLVHIKLMCT